MTAPVGLIAGNLSLPVLTAQKIKAAKTPLVVVGLKGETDPQVKSLADAYLEVVLGHIQPMAQFFLAKGVKTVCMVGGVSRENITGSWDPDEAAQDILADLDNFHTDAILRAAAKWLEDQGLTLVSVAELVPDLTVQPGLLTAKAPSPALLEDLRLAYRVAKELGRLDVGQTVVVSDKIAVALEGADGTNATIFRGASLCRKPIAVAKVVKPSQDIRFDLPVIGPETINVLTSCGAGALALDARGLIMLEKEECLAQANKAGLAIIAWLDQPEPL
ncbi:MAG: UDP-2,3-diacylglucosamine diphosphatase LpxI [Deltaproteobacteria bacterium]|nr:UDP-2,3-diacylglucosamine diphosphatase LpxI [Deltaproteobacteria bacterium]